MFHSANVLERSYCSLKGDTSTALADGGAVPLGYFAGRSPIAAVPLDYFARGPLLATQPRPAPRSIQ